MKKQSLKARLSLNRETLRSLDAEALTAAEGGAATTGGINTANCYLTQTCNTCNNCLTQTCPTRCGQWYCYAV
jgi:hypothetical protein